jgi:hypothetical protein
MKKYILRIITLLIIASAALPSCSIEYRQRHHRDNHERHDNNERHDRN